MPPLLACPTLRGAPAKDANGQVLLDGTMQKPVNQMGEQLPVNGFQKMASEPVEAMGAAIFADGLLARARAEWG